jgi:tripartite-type tricarboxylate transporter receptor subunit TctC
MTWWVSSEMAGTLRTFRLWFLAGDTLYTLALGLGGAENTPRAGNVGGRTAGGGLVFVNTAVPANTLQDLIAHIKSRPGQFNFSSGGTGTVPHFAGELLNFMAKIRMTHVPYKGGAPASAAMISGEVSMYIDTPTAMLQFVKQGKIKALGVAAKERFSLLPEVPTMAEAGLPGYEIRVWYGFFVPAKTPRPIVDRLHQEITRALATEDVKSRLAAIGTQPAGNGPDEFRPIVQAELQKWAKVARESGIKPE